MLYNAYSQHVAGGHLQHQRTRKDPIAYLNVMFVGKTGVGKTAFIRTLCEYLHPAMIQGTFKESKPMVLKTKLQPTEDFYSVSMHMMEADSDERTSLTLIDTPGISPMLSVEDQLQYISKYIDLQFERTLAEETKIKRNVKAIDTHIHACVYFLDTTQLTDGLTDVDKYMMRMLSSRVNIIPVLGKADTLTVTQREVMKKSCRADLFDLFKIPVYGYIDLDDDDDDGEEEEGDTDTCTRTPPFSQATHCDSTALGNILKVLKECVDEDPDAAAMIAYLQHMPLCLMGYEEDPATGQPVIIEPTPQNNNYQEMPSSLTATRRSGPVLGRRYVWATVECFNPDHCDFAKFKQILSSTHRDMLRIDTFERFYEKYRTDVLMSRQASKVLALGNRKGR